MGEVPGIQGILDLKKPKAPQNAYKASKAKDLELRPL